jgi:[protein-PII] uridylyltransferase
MFEPLFRALDAESGGAASIPAFKQAHKDAAALLAERFHAGDDVVELVHGRAEFVDGLLQRAWIAHMPQNADATLIAVGGYGRRELHPGSDVDVLILTAEDPQRLASAIEPLVMFLWDIGLEIGHSVRSLEQCIDEARADVTVVTNLMESRLLAGRPELFARMSERTSVRHIWPSDKFFSAKLAEQKARHNKVNGSSHDLEPNIKTNPGGLRDFQMIGWIAKRHFGADNLLELVGHGFLTEHEYDNLRKGEHFLSRVRFGLHLLTGRHEDRLLFEYQRKLATQFGYSDENTNLAVEQFMQHYYRAVVKMQRLNEMLLQLFKETILLHNQLGEPRPINRRFQARGDYIEVVNPAIFARNPLAMLEIFLLLQQHPELKGVRASTIRSIRAHRHLIDARLRASIGARSMFMEMLRQPSGITHQLRRMHRYGILARYIPAFYKITGLMQFDLFHVYTVDEHILMVLRNLRRFVLPGFVEECRLCHELAQRLPKLELLYLGGLFHDIAKGRGGDHSQLGAEDAYRFCREHDLSDYDGRLVAWLVEKHLVMSATAQRKDIDDPEIINDFAAQVGTRERLDYLYLLTVADMRGTNPELWNSWKSALMDRFYRRTVKALERGLDSPQDEDQVIQAVQEKARQLLLESGADEHAVHLCWMTLNTDYFLQTPPVTVAWHTQLLLNHSARPQEMNIFMHEDGKRGCCEIFTFGPDRDGLFAETTALLDQMAINILGARIDTTSEHLVINSYFVLEEDGSNIPVERRQEILLALDEMLNDHLTPPPAITRRMPRQLKSFVRETSIGIEQDVSHCVTVVTVVTHDRPGLLSLIGEVFAALQLRLWTARISTEGAIARDRFTLTDHEDQAVLDTRVLDNLRQALQDKLDD